MNGIFAQIMPLKAKDSLNCGALYIDLVGISIVFLSVTTTKLVKIAVVVVIIMHYC